MEAERKFNILTVLKNRKRSSWKVSISISCEINRVMNNNDNNEIIISVGFNKQKALLGKFRDQGRT